MLNFEKVKLNTHVDEVGFKYGLVREDNESIENYRNRLYKCVKETCKKDKDSFYRSLGYITALNEHLICEIDKNTNDAVRIVFTSSIVYVYRAGSLHYKEKLTELKFMKNLIQALNAMTFITVSNYDTKYDYYRVENILPLDTDRVRLDFVVGEQVQKLPKKYIKDVYDYDGDFATRVADEDQVNAETQYYIDGDILHKYKIKKENIGFEYEDFPLNLMWRPIKACFVNDEDFDYILKEAIVDNENFGTITTTEEKQTEKLLSQDGSVIINKILEKQNTYWGE